MISATLKQHPDGHILELQVHAPKEPEQQLPNDVPKFTVYIDESWNSHDYITPAITDVVARTFTNDQITLITACEEAPNHLEVQKSTKIEAAHAANQNLILITKDSDSQDSELTILNGKTGESFKAENHIELLDALCDFIKPLREKTMVNVEAQLTFDEPIYQAKALQYVPAFELKDSIATLRLTDLASETQETVSIKLPMISSTIKITYEFDDLTLGRKVSGGLSLFP